MLLVLIVAAVIPATNGYLNDSRAQISGGRMLHELGVSIVLLTAIPEEFAFRGVLPGSAVRLWGAPWPATLITSALFVLWHIEPTLHAMRDNRAVAGAAARAGGQVLVVLGAIAVTFVAGLLVCRLRLRSRSAGTISAPDHASDERASAQLSEPGADSIPPRWGVGEGAGHRGERSRTRASRAGGQVQGGQQIAGSGLASARQRYDVSLTHMLCR